MKNGRAYLLILSAIILFAAGCGGSSVIPLGEGNLAGYIYAKDYNSAGAARQVMVAGATVPNGYTPVVGAKVELLDSAYSSVTTGGDGKFTFTTITAGQYTVRVTKKEPTTHADLMTPLQFTVTVVRDTTTVLNDSYPISDTTMYPSATGTLRVSAQADCANTVPVSGEILINGNDTFATTPATIINLIPAYKTFSDIAPGTYRVTVTADGYLPQDQDAVITTGAQTDKTFRLAYQGNSKPSATITTPINNSTVTQGATVTLTGAGTDCEDGAMTGSKLTWISSIDGALGTGVTVSLTTLSIGTHTITLNATDSGGAYGAASVTLKVIAVGPNTAPTANITSPVAGASFDHGATINFTGIGIDTEDGTITGALVWKVDNVQIGTGIFVQKANLSVGSHTVTLTVTDSGGKTNTASETITVTGTAADNTAPVARIVTPADGSIYVQGASITFTGVAADLEDGTITGSQLVWKADGVTIGTGGTFIKANLTPGTHSITLTATDLGGLTDIATVSVSVVSAPTNNNSPVVLIATPTNGSTYVHGANILFSGVVADAEDGALSGTSLVWLSDLDGSLGTGTSVQSTNLRVGTHVITLIATDSGHSTGSASVTITVTAAP
jgi:hypothetical protein